MVSKGIRSEERRWRAAIRRRTLDISNPEAVKWYQGKLAGLLKMGVGAIKADFGEGAPLTGQYASGRTGWYEHNLYPLRYNKAVADITKEVTGENVIWARSAWAGSQRYPLHWGGDAENTDSAMAGELEVDCRLGCRVLPTGVMTSAALCEKAPRDLYRRWLGLGRADVAHSRARCAAARTVGIRRGFDRGFSPCLGSEVFADAVHLCSGERLFRARLSDAAHTVLRVSGRSDVMDDR